MRWRKPTQAVLFLVLVTILAKVGLMLWQKRTEGVPLRIMWEGAWLDLNTRDVGESINSCLGSPLMKEGILQRANGWFSGWSCDRVGKPDVIYSLNHDKARNERYYCRADKKNIVGLDFGGDVPLKDLEFLESWDLPEQREVACAFLKASFSSLSEGKKVLIHCDAGRDRTGTFAALMTALVAESKGRLDRDTLQAIECDYRKTRSLTPNKFGRMQRFIQGLIDDGGVRLFLTKRCGISQSELDRFVETMRAP